MKRVFKPLSMLSIVVLMIACVMSAVSSSHAEALPREWNFDNGVEGWKAHNDCTVKARDGSLHITTTGSDPYFASILKNPVPAGWVQIRLTATSSIKGTLDALWRYENTSGFSSNQLVRTPLKAGTNANEYVLTFRATHPVDAIRIDPGQKSGKISITSITLTGLKTPPPIQLAPIPSNIDTFILWQLPSQTGTQIMSYVIRTVNGKIIVVDGGMPGDEQYLRRFLAGFGNHVDAWFLSHPHVDHASALTSIAKSPGAITIDRVYASLPSQEWMEGLEKGTAKTLKALTNALSSSYIPVTEPHLGAEYTIGGILFEILGVKNPEITPNACNNSCLIWRMSDKKKSILFLGDLGVEGGNKILAGPYRDRLTSDYVQMAHHGQTGVSEAFYKVVAPTHCLWPTPLWLWDVDNGGGKGSGPWKTLEVRAWMDKLGVQHHYIMKDGLIRIE